MWRNLNVSPKTELSIDKNILLANNKSNVVVVCQTRRRALFRSMKSSIAVDSIIGSASTKKISIECCCHSRKQYSSSCSSWGCRRRLFEELFRRSKLPPTETEYNHLFSSRNGLSFVGVVHETRVLVQKFSFCRIPIKMILLLSDRTLAGDFKRDQTKNVVEQFPENSFTVAPDGQKMLYCRRLLTKTRDTVGVNTFR